MKFYWSLIFLASINGSIAYGNDLPGAEGLQQRLLGGLHRAMVGELSQYSWFDKVDAIFELAAEKLHSGGHLGHCSAVFNFGQPDAQFKEENVPYFRLAKLDDSVLECDSMEHSFQIAASSKDSTFSLGREWAEPMVFSVSQGSFVVSSRALLLRFRYWGGEALLASDGPVTLLLGRFGDVLSARVMTGKCELVSFKRIKSDSSVELVKLFANPGATWQLANGKILHENEAVDLLPSGLDNWTKLTPPSPPPLPVKH